MTLENAEDFLKRFDYEYYRENDNMIIKLNQSLGLELGLTKKGELIVTEKLIDWNFLTGFIKTSIKKALILNLSAITFVSFIISLLNVETAFVFFLTSLIWSIIWGTLYINKAANAKELLIHWSH